MKRLILISFLAVLLSACGFHLRGVIPIPPAMQETYITGASDFSDLYIELRRGLERSGANVVGSAQTASATLAVSGEQLDRRVLTVDAQGRASEYELNYSVSFELRDKAGVVLVPRQTVNQLRDYKFDPDNVLAKDTEEALLRKSLVTFAVSQIMRRIDAGLKHPPKPTPSDKPNEGKI